MFGREVTGSWRGSKTHFVKCSSSVGAGGAGGGAGGAGVAGAGAEGDLCGRITNMGSATQWKWTSPIYIEQMVGYESDGADKHFRTLLGQKSGIKIPGRPRNRGKEEQCSKYDVEEETRDKYFVCTCCF